MADFGSKTTAFYPELKGKRALVTGAGKGIGRDCVRELVAQGCQVIALSRTQSDLDEVQEDFGSQVTTKCLDITDWDGVDQWFQTLPPLNYLVNNAAVLRVGSILEISKEELQRVMDTNFMAHYHFSQLAAQNMMKNDIKGTIVNLSSFAGKRASPYNSAYCCAKAALNMLTQCLTAELAPRGIRAVTLSPGFVWTGMITNNPNIKAYVDHFQQQHPGVKVAEVEDVSRTLSFLLSDNAGMMNGSIAALDSGILV